MTDGGAADAKLTTAEQRKLEAARQAVERARLAGTLHRTRAARGHVEPLPPDWEAQKRAMIRARAPRPFADDAAAGVGPRPSVQKTGPAGLSAAEKAKLERGPAASKDRDPNEGGR